jgi:hypothetical protein
MKTNLFVTPIQEFAWNRSLAELEGIETSIRKNKSIENSKFISWVLECSAEYARTTGKKNGYLICKDIWYRTMVHPHSYVPPHIHPSSWAVGSFYFEDGQGDLVLIDPRGYISEWSWTEVSDIDGNLHSSCTDYYYQPKKNTCIFFPGYIKHLVLPSNDTRQRTAISWNIIFEQDCDVIKQYGIEDYKWIKI